MRFRKTPGEILAGYGIKNSTIVGDVNLNAGTLVDDDATHTESGRYVQMNEEMFKIDDYNFTLTLDKTAIQANDKVNVTVSIDKDYYFAEYHCYVHSLGSYPLQLVWL